MVRKLISIPVELDVKDPITGEDSWSITGYSLRQIYLKLLIQEVFL